MLEFLSIAVIGIPFWLLAIELAFFSFIGLFGNYESRSITFLGYVWISILLITLVIFNGFSSIGAILFGSILYLGLYIVSGVIWSFIRWYLYCTNKDNLEHAKDCFDRYTKTKSDYERTMFIKSLHNPLYYRNQIHQIQNWIIFWPLSIINTFFGDIMSRIFRNIFNVFGILYSKLSPDENYFK